MNPVAALVRSLAPDVSILRIGRFGTIGIACLGAQLGLVWAAQVTLNPSGIGQLIVNLAAFGLSTQINYAGQRCFTWADRHGGLIESWLRFNASRLVGFLVYGLILSIALTSVNPLAATVVATIPAWLINYVLGDRWVFPIEKPGIPTSTSIPIVINATPAVTALAAASVVSGLSEAGSAELADPVPTAELPA